MDNKLTLAKTHNTTNCRALFIYIYINKGFCDMGVVVIL